MYLDLTGLRGLFGDEPAIGRRLREAAAARGLAVKVGVGGSRASAGLAAHLAQEVSVIAAGEEAAALAPAPLSLLGASPETLAVLERWGLSTMGALAALAPVALFERLGAEGLRLRELALGRDPHPLTTWEPPRVFEESTALDWVVAELDPLGEIVNGLAGRVCARLEADRLDADRIGWTLSLADRRLHEGTLSPAVPTREPAALAALIRNALEARPPAAGVIAVTLRAYPVRVPVGQSSLMDPPRPSARALAQTLARLTALVGPARVGMAVLLDSHRPDALRVDGEAALSPPQSGAAGAHERRPTLALRRLRPTGRAAVRLIGGRPVHLRADRLGGPIVASVGPWRTSGEWWLESRWLSDEWDVELADGTLCRLAHDGSVWSLEGIYD